MERSPTIPLSAFIAITVIIGGFFWIKGPLESKRPAPAAKSERPAFGMEDVEARLWQDPFGAVDKALAKARKEEKVEGGGPATEPHDLKWLAEQIKARPALKEPRAAESSGSNDPFEGVQVLAVLVAGGPSLGSAELRRRDRYAVLSGLMLERFLPDDPEHIGYVNLELDQQSPPQHIPFEWFSSLRRRPSGEGSGRDQQSGKTEEHLTSEGQESQDSPTSDLLLLWIDQAGLMQSAETRQSGAEAPATVPGLPGGADAGGSDGRAEHPGSDLSEKPGKTAEGKGDSKTASGPRILARLSRLFSEIHECSGVPSERMRFSVVGPRNSTGLRAIAEEYAPYERDVAAACTAKPKQIAAMWSPFATVPDVQAPPDLPKGVCDCPSPGLSHRCVAIRPPGPRQRSIADDGVLVDLLVAELRRRHVGPNSGVALVGQWDTTYSRTLARRFKEVWLKAHDLERRWGPDRRVFRFSYMRGLDGAVPGGNASNANQDQGRDSGKAIERAAGDAQLDYLRRMENALLDKHAELSANCTLTQRFSQDCGIRAIGVLGNDYFDKLLVLKALKPVFGNAIFFTTDLDADMLHPEDNRATRNLIVASGFGLSLKRRLQREVPPLRDSYQTSLLLAVRLALRPEGESGRIALPPPARLYEIGRTRAVELVTAPEMYDAQGFLRPAIGEPEAKGPQVAEPADRDPHPQEELNAYYRPAPGRASTPVVALGVAVVLAAFLLALSLGLDRVTRTLAVWWKGLTGSPAAMAVLAFTLAPVILLVAGASWDLANGGEPLSFLQGVSIWPSEALRLLGGLAAVAFLVIGHRRLRRERMEIERDFGLQPDGQWPTDGEPRESATSVEPEQQPRGESVGSQAAPIESGGRASGTVPDPAGCGSDLHDGSTANSPLSSPAEIWRHYIARCRVLPRWLVPKDLRDCLTERCAPGWDHHSVTTRLTIQVVLFFLLALTLLVALGFPNRPVRSDLAWQIDFGVIVLVLIPFLALLFYVIDATRQTLILAGELAGPVRWPPETLARLGLGRWSWTPEGGAAYPGDVDWLDVRLIARVSRAVGDLVWYPVLVLIVLALGRHPMFDSLDMPPALAILMAVVLLCVVACAWVLRRAAERVRSMALRNLGQARLRAQAEAGGQACIAQLDTLLKWVADERDGAFRPFSQQPVVQALLTLLSSVSGLALIEYSSMINL